MTSINALCCLFCEKKERYICIIHINEDVKVIKNFIHASGQTYKEFGNQYLILTANKKLNKQKNQQLFLKICQRSEVTDKIAAFKIKETGKHLRKINTYPGGHAGA